MAYVVYMKNAKNGAHNSRWFDTLGESIYYVEKFIIHDVVKISQFQIDGNNLTLDYEHISVSISLR